MFNSRRFNLITILFLIGIGLIGFQIIRQAKAYQKGREAYTRELHFENRLLNFDEWFEDGTREQKQERIRSQEIAFARPLKLTNYWSLGFGVLALVYLVFGLQFGRDRRTGTLAIIITALSCLVVGLLAPMLEIAAFQEDLSIPLKIKTGFLSLDLDYTQEFPGAMYFYYQSKSVLELIGLLFRQLNLVVGISILLFSVFIPVGKNCLSLYTLYHGKLPESRPLRWLMLRSGKWSMADVFVIAIFLGFLAFNNMQTGIQTESHILNGLYFFLAYALLAIWASVRVEKHLQEVVQD